MAKFTGNKKLSAGFLQNALDEQGESYKFLSDSMGCSEKHLMDINDCKAEPTDVELIDMAMLLGIRVRHLLGRNTGKEMIGLDTKSMHTNPGLVASGSDCILSAYAMITFTNGEREFLPVSQYLIDNMKSHIRMKEPFGARYGNNCFVYLNPKFIEEVRLIDLSNYDESLNEASEYSKVVNPGVYDLADMIIEKCDDEYACDNPIASLEYERINNYCSKFAYEKLRNAVPSSDMNIMDLMSYVSYVYIRYENGRTNDFSYDWWLKDKSISDDLHEFVQAKDSDKLPLSISFHNIDGNADCLDGMIINLDSVAMLSFPIELGEREVDISR